jgi:hypothetical protein
MNTTTTISALAILCACATAASAQQPTGASTSQTTPLGGKLSIGVNVGAQTRSSTSSSEFTFPIYNQTARVNTQSSVDGGPLFDIGATYRVVQKFGVGVGYSSFSRTGSAQANATIPSPVFFNGDVSALVNPIDAKHTENNFYIIVAGFVPITDVIELSLFVGPSFTKVKQDVINASSVSVPAGTQTVVSALASESGTAKGVNVGADLAYRFTKLVGAGAFIRYNGGSVDLPTLSGVKAGGLQIGIGARLHF